MELSRFRDVKTSEEVKNKSLELLQNYETRVGL